MKKRLSEQQEFEIVKMVFDKFLWLGFALMAFGVYKIFASGISAGLIWVISGIMLFILFIALILNEYELIR